MKISIYIVVLGVLKIIIKHIQNFDVLLVIF